jgi:DNA (cytosine-5)-methyltransferase 1
MNAPRQLTIPWRDLLIVDLFAGGGGASLGLEQATGVHVGLAVNHDEHAIRMHAENHPHTLHRQSSVWDVSPAKACRGDTPDVLWASPDCTHFSKAKGAVPRRQEIRGLAWVVVRWVEQVRPRVIFIENVVEFLTWGPLGEDGYPIKSRAGETFREFVAALESHGYAVDWRALRGCDYGAPTTRERLFIVARRDGAPIVWPEPTHYPRFRPKRSKSPVGHRGPAAGRVARNRERRDAWAKERRGRPLYRTAAECIDWSIPACSIFATKEEARDWAKRHGVNSPRRPLAPKTMARIAEGIRRYVLHNPTPYLLCLTHGGRLEPLDAPMRTVTAAPRGERAVVTPHITKMYGTSTGSPVDDPTPTVTGAGQHLGLVAASLVNTRNGERKGQRPRAIDIGRPLGTITAQGSQGAIVAAWLAKHYGGVYGQPLDTTIGTVTARDHHALCAAFLQKYYGRGVGQGLGRPLDAVTGRDTFGLVTVKLGGDTYRLVDVTMRMLQPRELARAQGFPDRYVLNGTKTQKVARIGNSVCPDVVRALVSANVRRAS